jgi:Flp pilus assembly protein TadD
MSWETFYCEQRDFAAAADAYQVAITLTPDHAVFHGNLAMALAGRRDIDGAIREYMVAIGLKPDKAVWHNELGRLYYEQQDFTAAADAARAAITLTPDDAAFHGNLAVALAGRRRRRRDPRIRGSNRTQARRFRLPERPRQHIL